MGCSASLQLLREMSSTWALVLRIWRWFIPSEDEWYKAAYYKGGSANAGYWDYPTQSNAAPGRDLDDLLGNAANYYQIGSGYALGSPYYRTVVGAFQNSASHYGTYDQGGNVAERNETVTEVHLGRYCRGVRGGSFSSGVNQLRASASTDYYYPTEESDGVGGLGFRVAAVPEPASFSAVTCGLVLLAAGIRRRK